MWLPAVPAESLILGVFDLVLNQNSIDLVFTGIKSVLFIYIYIYFYGRKFIHFHDTWAAHLALPCLLAFFLNLWK